MTHRGNDTYQRMLDAGLLIAHGGLHKVTSRSVGAAVGVAHSNVLYHFGSVDRLRDLVARYAVQRGDKIVIERLKLDNHPALVPILPPKVAFG